MELKDKRKDLSLGKYEEKCPICKGKGKYFVAAFGIRKCWMCKGRGKIDWIDKIKNGIKK